MLKLTCLKAVGISLYDISIWLKTVRQQILYKLSEPLHTVTVDNIYMLVYNSTGEKRRKRKGVKENGSVILREEHI